MLTTNFNIKNYNIIIQKIIDSGYKFIQFPKRDNSKISNEKEILLRHDIDFSLLAAREIAQQDYNLGVQSTFFIYLNSPFYNILFEEDKKHIDEIIKFGHDIALHFNERINIGFDKEIEILSKIFLGVRTDIISLHKPLINEHTQTVLKDFIPKHIITTYDYNLFKQIEYISDSKHNFNKMKLYSILKSNKSFQLLLHPLWWYFEGNSPEEKLRALCNEKLIEVQKNIKKDISIENLKL